MARRCCARHDRRCVGPTCTCGTAGWPEFRIRSSLGTSRPACSIRSAGRSPSLDGSTLREGDRAVFFDVHRTCGRCRACTVHHTPTRCPARRVYGITDSGSMRAVRRMGAVHLSRARRRHRKASGLGLVRGLHWRRVRPADRGPHHRTGRASAGGDRARARRWRRRSERDCAGSARGRRDDLRGWRPALPARRWHVRWVPTGVRPERYDGRAAARRRSCGRRTEKASMCRSKRLDPRERSKKASSSLRDGGRYVVAGHYTDVGPSTINAHQHINRKHLDIRGCWGSRVEPLPGSAPAARSSMRTVPWRASARAPIRCASSTAL